MSLHKDHGNSETETLHSSHVHVGMARGMLRIAWFPTPAGCGSARNGNRSGPSRRMGRMAQGLQLATRNSQERSQNAKVNETSNIILFYSTALAFCRLPFTCPSVFPSTSTSTTLVPASSVRLPHRSCPLQTREIWS